MENSKEIGHAEFEVEVAYAGEFKQAIILVQVKTGYTVLQAIEISKILSLFPEINIETAKTGIFGRVVTPETFVKAGDRVEIYRDLLQDPKKARRTRAALAAKQKRGVRLDLRAH
jgi:putative ubiquitin-RnfH superfamily antitoxin RatB of RatAB toxin-antitoxin module